MLKPSSALKCFPPLSPSLLRAAVLAFAALLACQRDGVLRAQSTPESCRLQKGSYLCNWQEFQARFDAVRTVSLQVRPMDRTTESRLRMLVRDLGKQLAQPGQPGDVIFRIVPANRHAIVVGPADQPLVSLEVLAPGVDGGVERLLWVETLVGQADRPWPALVNTVADQFRARLQKPRPEPHSRSMQSP